MMQAIKEKQEQELHISPILGIYLGKKDKDLSDWKQSCENGEAKRFTKAAIREKLKREKGLQSDAISLQQAVRVLMQQSDMLIAILEHVQRFSMSTPDLSTVIASGSSNEPEDSSQADAVDYVSACEDLGWETLE